MDFLGAIETAAGLPVPVLALVTFVDQRADNGLLVRIEAVLVEIIGAGLKSLLLPLNHEQLIPLFLCQSLEHRFHRALSRLGQHLGIDVVRGIVREMQVSVLVGPGVHFRVGRRRTHA